MHFSPASTLTALDAMVLVFPSSSFTVFATPVKFVGEDATTAVATAAVPSKAPIPPATTHEVILGTVIATFQDDGTPVDVTNDNSTITATATDIEKRGIVKRSFRQTCEQWTMLGARLQAICWVNSQQRKVTELDLNRCLLNADGTLHWGPNGGFGASCTDMGVPPWSGIMTYNCRRADQSWNRAEINLDERVHNRNGNLICSV